MEIIDLSGKKELVVGVANADSPAWFAAPHFRAAGADLAHAQQAFRSHAAVLGEPFP
ncbi:MAG: hypothetical protein JSR28_04480 [Proteobacteria bacterium]|nr:hypothetical protein [Pseudomonadota bacterium]